MAINQPLAMFTSADGKTRLQIRLQDDSLWLTQKQISELFERSNKTISEHLNNIYDEGELEPNATIRKFRTVALEGPRDVERLLDNYNLDAVSSVGYRVRSVRGTQFRKWASEVLKEYLIKGFAMDDERLKNPDKDIKTDYFDELLERIATSALLSVVFIKKLRIFTLPQVTIIKLHRLAISFLPQYKINYTGQFMAIRQRN